MRSVHGDKLRCINYSMLCTVRSFRYKVNNTPTYSLSLLWLCPRTVVYDFPASVFRPSAATSNTWRFKQTLSNPGWRVMHKVRSPMASSMTSSQRSISLQQMHSCAFVTRLTEQFEHEHLQNNVKNSSNTRKIRLYKIINCLTSSIKLSHKIRTTANHIATNKTHSRVRHAHDLTSGMLKLENKNINLHSMIIPYHSFAGTSPEYLR